MINNRFTNGALHATNSGMLHELRYALRTFRQSPGFAATAILSIALAIGANTSIFSLAEAMLLRPLPVPDPSSVVSVRSIAPSSSISTLVNTGMALSYPDYVDFRDKSGSFDGLIAYELKGVAFSKDEHSQAQFKMGYLVSGNMFRVLGIEPAMGRRFRPEEDQVPGRDSVVTLLGSAGMMGLVLALSGLYAVISYQTAGRTREIGIRMALGAERPQVMWMVLKRAGAMGAAGVVIGIGLTYALRGALSAGEAPSPVDPWQYALVPLALFGTALLAAATPALRASRTDPLAALREE